MSAWHHFELTPVDLQSVEGISSHSSPYFSGSYNRFTGFRDDILLAVLCMITLSILIDNPRLALIGYEAYLRYMAQVTNTLWRVENVYSPRCLDVVPQLEAKGCDLSARNSLSDDEPFRLADE